MIVYSKHLRHINVQEAGTATARVLHLTVLLWAMGLMVPKALEAAATTAAVVVEVELVREIVVIVKEHLTKVTAAAARNTTTTMTTTATRRITISASYVGKF